MKKIISIMVCGLIMVCGAMASTNEITTQVLLKVSKDAVQLTRSPGTKLLQMTGNRYHTYVYPATSTNLPLSKGSISDLGWAYAINLSSNNSVYFSITSTNGAISTNMCIEAEEFSLWRFCPSFSITNMNVSVTGGVADVEVTIIEK